MKVDVQMAGRDSDIVLDLSEFDISFDQMESKGMMNTRERILTASNWEEPDRVPLQPTIGSFPEVTRSGCFAKPGLA